MIFTLKNRLDMSHNTVIKNKKTTAQLLACLLKTAISLVDSGNFSAANQLTEFHG